jgi:hypothetical protein
MMNLLWNAAAFMAAEVLLASYQVSASDARFAVGDPVAHFEFHHLALTVRKIKFKGAIEGVRCLLVVIKHEVAAYGRNPLGELNTESPAGDIHLVNALVAEIAVARIPDPVPVVVKAVVSERLQGRRSGPEVIVNPGWNRFLRCVSDRVTPFEAESST